MSDTTFNVDHRIAQLQQVGADLRVERQHGQVEVFSLKTVTEFVTNPAREISLVEARKTQPEVAIGTELRFPKSTDGLGRTSAQLAKQVIF